MGKTRLIQQVAEMSRGLGMNVLFGSANSLASTVPYSVWRNIMPTVLSQIREAMLVSGLILHAQIMFGISSAIPHRQMALHFSPICFHRVGPRTVLSAVLVTDGGLFETPFCPHWHRHRWYRQRRTVPN